MIYVGTILHRAFRDAVRWHALVRNPAEAADPPRTAERREMRTWTAAELGAFLDHVADDRLAVAWSLLANTGMRRGEVLGLRWADVDLEEESVRIVRTLIASEEGMSWGTPKTAKGRRTVALDAATTAELRGYRARQAAERLAIGPGYDDGDLVVFLPDGRPVHPNTLS